MKVNFLRFSAASANDLYAPQMEMYLAHGEGYLRYVLTHIRNADTNADCYILGVTSYTDAELYPCAELTVPGEWEMAVRLKGRDDFSGGRMHGDERMTGLAVFADGLYTETIGQTGDVPFTTLTIVETSDVYDPADHTTIIARHGKEYRFEGNRLTIEQYLDWLVEGELTDSYMAMFPVSKAVTEQIYTNRELIPRKVSYGLFDGVNSAFSFGAHFGARFYVERYTKPLDSLTLRVTDNGNGGYHKQYFLAAQSGDTVKPGDRWDTRTGYELYYTP